MDTVEAMLMVMNEARELARRLEGIQQRIGNVGSPELADIGGGETIFLPKSVAGTGGGGVQGCDAAPMFSSPMGHRG